MAHGAAASLIAAAETLEAAGQSLQAIKCLEAALSSGALLPTAEVVARVRLATCLLRHTDCAVTAKFRLEPAQLLLKRLAGAGHQSACAPLQADFFSALAAVYERLPGYGAKCKAALKKGLQITLQSQGWCVHACAPRARAFILSGRARRTDAPAPHGWTGRVQRARRPTSTFACG
jgi:hypothetical protein